jgi:putative Mn2+ efflux pump MntP
MSTPRRARDEPAAAARALRAWPLLVVLAGVVGGLVLATLGQETWRAGCLLIGASLGVGAVLRAALPSREAGLLQVRGKAFDITVLVVLAVAVIVLAIAVPPEN